MRHVIAVDTGLRALGWAAWSMKRVNRMKFPEAPDWSGVTVPKKQSKTACWTLRARSIIEEFYSEVATLKPKIIAVEWPEFRSGSAVGHAAAGRADLTKLAFMAGMHAWQAEMFKADFMIVPVSAWKGMLPKDVVEQRLDRAKCLVTRRGSVSIQSHAIDAVGIGLYAMGFRMDHKAFAQNGGGK